jgi:class 3 adenylate cyclase
MDAPGWLKRQRLGVKLGLAFSLLVGLVALSAVVSIRSLSRVTAHYEDALALGSQLATEVEGLRAELHGARRRERAFLQRWPGDGVALARDTWVQRPPHMSRLEPWPADANGTVSEHLGRFASGLGRVEGLLNHAAKISHSGSAVEAALVAEMQRFGEAIPEARAALHRYTRHLAHLVAALEARGDVAETLAPTPAGVGLSPAVELRRATWALASAAGGVSGGGLAVARLQDRLGRYHRAMTGRLPYLRADPEGGDEVDEDDLDATGDGDAPASCDDERDDAGTSRRRARAAGAVREALEGVLAQADGEQRRRIEDATKAWERAFDALVAADDEVDRTIRGLLCQGLVLERDVSVFTDAGPGAISALMEEAEASIVEARSLAWLFSLACVVVAILCSVVLSRQIRVPVRSLVETAQAVAGGDLGARARVYSADDEIGELATSFNAMTAQLQEQRGRIEAQLAELQAERARSEALLRNILPAPIAERLKRHEQPIADAFGEATVLFADVVGYTELADRVPPTELVQHLGAIFEAFDEVAGRHGIEKIKTIGDAYMAAAGLPAPQPDHARRMVDAALDMLQSLAALNEQLPEPVALRIGVNTGPVVAGVIGSRKFIYDLWGDAVNVASRMESHGVPGAVQVPDHVKQRLGDAFEYEDRGLVDVKGKGPMRLWLVRRRREP